MPNDSITVVESEDPFLSVVTSVSIPNKPDIAYTTTSSYPEKDGPVNVDTIISTLTGHISLLREELKLLKKVKE